MVYNIFPKDGNSLQVDLLVTLKKIRRLGY